MPRYKVHVRRDVTEYHNRVDYAEIEVEADGDSPRELRQAIKDADDNGDIEWEVGDSEQYDTSVERPEVDDNYDVEALDPEPDEDDDAEPDETNDDEPTEVDKLLAIANTDDDE